MPDGPNLRGSAPLHHIDSVHLRGEGADHHEDDDEEHNGDVASTDLESAPPQPVRRATDMIPAEERQWKDDIVGWDSKRDPANPKVWSFRRRYLITMLLGGLTMCASFASSIFSSGSAYIAAEYGVSTEVMTLGTSLFLLGYIPGPVIFAPLSELYGRRIVLIPMFIFICFSAGTATAKDLQTIFITRFFAGVMASAPVTTVGGGLADMFDQKERGTAVVMYSLAVVGGPTIAPVIGAAVSQSYLGWRWTEYLVVILTSAVLVPGAFLVPETFAPVILTKKASMLRKKTGRWALHSRHEMNDFAPKMFIEKVLLRPLRMIALEPAVLCITTYNAFTYGILYLLFGAVPIIFGQQKGWTDVQAALPFLAVLVGTMIAAGINLLYSKYVFGPHLDRHGGRAQPEMRLPPMMLGGIAFPVGFFLLGWADTVGQLFGLIFIGSAFLLIFQASQTSTGFYTISTPADVCSFEQAGINFLIDAYTIHAASAVAANTFMRSILAAALPLVAQPLFNNLGIGIACTILGCIAAALGTVPFLFYVFGARLRAMSKMAADGDRNAKPPQGEKKMQKE